MKQWRSGHFRILLKGITPLGLIFPKYNSDVLLSSLVICWKHVEWQVSVAGEENNLVLMEKGNKQESPRLANNKRNVIWSQPSQATHKIVGDKLLYRLCISNLFYKICQPAVESICKLHEHKWHIHSGKTFSLACIIHFLHSE